MHKNFSRILFGSLVIALVGVFVIDYLSHKLFSAPMETQAYFLTKASLFFIYSLVFLSYVHLDRHEFRRVLLGGIIVASIWGTYYNILPALFDFYPFGIPLEGLTFLGMGLFGTGVAFGIVHTAAFVGGYYAQKSIFKKQTNP